MKHPIEDEALADRVIELFLAGYDPYLFAGNFGLTPEIVLAQIRATLQIHLNKSLETFHSKP